MIFSSIYKLLDFAFPILVIRMVQLEKLVTRETATVVTVLVIKTVPLGKFAPTEPVIVVQIIHVGTKNCAILTHVKVRILNKLSKQ